MTFRSFISLSLGLCLLTSCASQQSPHAVQVSSINTPLSVLSGSSEISDSTKITPTDTKSNAGSKTVPASSKTEKNTNLKQNELKEIQEKAQIIQVNLNIALENSEYNKALALSDELFSLYTPYPDLISQAESLRTHIINAFSSINITKIDVPSETVAGNAFKKSYKILVSNIDTNKPLTALPISITNPSEEIVASTDQNGELNYQAPVPQQATSATISFDLMFTSKDEQTQKALQSLSNLHLKLPYKVSTNAKKYSTSISVLDYDKNDKPLRSSNPFATTLLKPLINKGFSPIGMSEFVDQIAQGDSALVTKAAKSLFGSSVRRLIWGTAKYKSLEKNDQGEWLCTLVCDIKVYDFTTAQEVFSVILEDSGTGKTESLAVTAARSKLAGEILVDALTYGM